MKDGGMKCELRSIVTASGAPRNTAAMRCWWSRSVVVQ